MPNQAAINPDPKGAQATLSALVELRDCAREFMHDVPGELINKYTGLPSASRLRSAIVCANFAISQRKGRVMNTAAILHALLGILDKLEGRAASIPCFIAATSDPGLKAAIEYAHEAINTNARNCDIYPEPVFADKAFDSFCMKTREGTCKPKECSIPTHTGASSCQLAWLLSKAESEVSNG